MNYDIIEEIVRSCPVEYYLSANDNCNVEWDYRMQPVHEATQRYADNARKFIVDSSFNDPEITNKDALDKARELGAYAVVLEDVYQDYAGTVEKVSKGLEMADAHAFSGTVIAPLQEPHVECWKDIGKPDTVAIGGMKDDYASEKVRVAKELREAVGNSVWIHGLGWGATDTLVNAIRDNPELVDSIDARTPYGNSGIWNGNHASLPSAIRSLANLVEACRRMNPEISDAPVDVTLGEFA